MTKGRCLRIVMFCHSLVSDWNHGNAHFLRGVATELVSRGHVVKVYEPRDAWSLRNLVDTQGPEPIKRFRAAYPALKSTRYDPGPLDLDRALNRADLVIVHEWNEPGLVKRIGRHRASGGGYKLLFHDTHHRSVTDDSMAAYDLSDYDGVLAFGGVIRDLYLSRGWAGKAWTWHEAADTRIFRPLRSGEPQCDLVWVGNWGDNERTRELREYLLGPVKRLGLKACVYGVRYPPEAMTDLTDARIAYRGWIANFDVPREFGRYRATVHIPRRPYVKALPGIPTIRVFEALACGIPLVSAPWDDVEGLFSPGEDFLVARSGKEMETHLKALMRDGDMARALANRGLRTILARHTCAHRVDELLRIYSSLEAKEA